LLKCLRKKLQQMVQCIVCAWWPGVSVCVWHWFPLQNVCRFFCPWISTNNVSHLKVELKWQQYQPQAMFSSCDYVLIEDDTVGASSTGPQWAEATNFDWTIHGSTRTQYLYIICSQVASFGLTYKDWIIWFFHMLSLHITLNNIYLHVVYWLKLCLHCYGSFNLRVRRGANNPSP
jgi:hypothetical protein